MAALVDLHRAVLPLRSVCTRPALPLRGALSRSARRWRVHSASEEPATSDAGTSASENGYAPPAAGPVSFPLVDIDKTFAMEELVEELKDQQQLGQRGEAWFLAQAVLILLILVPPISLKGLVGFLGSLSIAGGVVVLGSALLSLGRNLSPLPQPRGNHELVTSGMYAYMRHPMYGGLLLSCFGLAAVTHSESRLALSALLWLVLEAKVGWEEKALKERYPQYAEYAQRVKKFFPYVY